MSVKPSARSRSSAMYQGATQIEGSRRSRIVVTSGGPSAASDIGALRTLAAPAAAANDELVRKSRRLWMICTTTLDEGAPTGRARAGRRDPAQRRQRCRAAAHGGQSGGPAARGRGG